MIMTMSARPLHCVARRRVRSGETKAHTGGAWEAGNERTHRVGALYQETNRADIPRSVAHRLLKTIREDQKDIIELHLH